MDVQVDASTKNHIDAVINKGTDDVQRFTSFYGEPITHLWHESWSLLHDLNNCMNLLWVCSGDFNELVSKSEKLGGNNRNRSQMPLFRVSMDECGFLDLGYVGSKFTWHKHFSDGHSIQKRLDWGLANNDWLLKFGGTTVHHLHKDTSNHCPLSLSHAGSEVLINAMVQAIPTYTMSYFKLPLGLWFEIECLVQKFWWGQWGDR